MCVCVCVFVYVYVCVKTSEEPSFVFAILSTLY